jgi:hypothetical protein
MFGDVVIIKQFVLVTVSFINQFMTSLFSNRTTLLLMHHYNFDEQVSPSPFHQTSHIHPSRTITQDS